MCKPSATRANEPNRAPPTISATIMKAQSQITAQVRRSARSWFSPRKTWLCPSADTAGFASAMAKILFQVGVNDFDQLLGGIGIERIRILFRINQMGADMILDHLRHQPGDGATNPGNHVHDPVTPHLAFEGAL